VENSLHFYFADFYYQNSYSKLLFTYYKEYCTELLTFFADKLIVMGNSEHSGVFNFAILLKSQKFDVREIYMLYSMLAHKLHTIYTSGNNKTVLN